MFDLDRDTSYFSIAAHISYDTLVSDMLSLHVCSFVFMFSPCTYVYEYGRSYGRENYFPSPSPLDPKLLGETEMGDK